LAIESCTDRRLQREKKKRKEKGAKPNVIITRGKEKKKKESFLLKPCSSIAPEKRGKYPSPFFDEEKRGGGKEGEGWD